MVSQEQTDSLDALESVMENVSERSKSFATDLLRKGRTYNLSDKQMYWVKRITTEASPTGDDNDGEAAIENPSMLNAEQRNKLDALELLRPNISQRSQNFAQSLIRQGRTKGWLSAKQMDWVEKLTTEGNDAKTAIITRDAKREAARLARIRHEIATTPVGDDEAEGGYEAVLELFDAAGSTLTRTKIHLLTDDGQEVVVRSNRRHGENNDVLYVHTHDCSHRDRDAHYGHITKATAAWNHTPATNEQIRKVMTEFRDNPIWVLSEMGRKSGRCCYCRLPLTDDRSTAHGYGPICAKHYRLPWSHATAQVIEGVIEAKVLEVIIMRDDEGNFAVKDIKTGEIICTFTSRQTANEYADQFSVVANLGE